MSLSAYVLSETVVKESFIFWVHIMMGEFKFDFFYWCSITHTVCVLEIKVSAKAAHCIKISFVIQSAVTLTSVKYCMKRLLLWHIFNDTEGKIISVCCNIMSGLERSNASYRAM
jgi:hypothetical protein